MKKIIASFLIFVFISLSLSVFVCAEYDTRQLPWSLPQIPEDYEHSHKYILLWEKIWGNGLYREVYLYYSHIPFSCVDKSGSSYIRYEYKKPETIRYKLVDGVFVYQGIDEPKIYFQGYYKDEEENKNIWLDFDEWLSNRDRLSEGSYPIASNVNIKFGDDIWDMSNGLYDLPPPELPPGPGDDDNSGLIGGIVGGILNGLKSLFIPERNIFQDIVAKFSDKFPIVNQVSSLISSLYNIGEVEPVFKFVYDGIELKLIDFTSFADYMPLIRNFTGAFLFLSFITREIKKLPGLIRGRE